MNTRSVVIIDDHPLFRHGVAELLDDSDQFQVLAHFGNTADIDDTLDDLAPDLLILDLHMPEQSGLEILIKVRQRPRPPKIVILTASDDGEDLLEAIRNGADGYLLKDTEPDDMLQRLSGVFTGQIAMNETSTTMLAKGLRSPPQRVGSDEPRSAIALEGLTERERQTLDFITQGLNNKLIARKLGISDSTVKVYVKNLLRKLNLHSRLELAAWAHNQNLSPMSKD